MSMKTLSRRDFLRVSGMTVAGIAMAACAAPAAPAAETGGAAAPSEGVTEIRVATWGDTTDKTVYESISDYIAEINPATMPPSSSIRVATTTRSRPTSPPALRPR